MEPKLSASPTIQRSISMPMKPHHSEPKKLQRSEEKEVLYEEKDDDYYPESPALDRNRKASKSADLIFEEGAVGHDHGFPTTKSINDLHFSNEWAGSTIELNADPRRNDLNNTSCCRSKHQYRVVEKSGSENVNYRNVPERPWRYIRDFVTTLVRPLLRFFPTKCITHTPSSASVTPTSTSSHLQQKHNTELSNADSYKISQSIEKKLDELEKLPHNRTRFPSSCDENDGKRERVTFSL